VRLLVSLSITFLAVLAVAAKLPTGMDTILKNELGDYKERLDLVLTLGEQKWLLIKPDKEIRLEKNETDNLVLIENPEITNSEITLVMKTETKDFLFSNGWIYTQINNNSIKSFDYYPQIFQDILLQSKIHQEFIVPKKFNLPRDLAFLAGRIPMSLGSIELASDRELLYKEKLKQIESEKPFQFLTYSYNSGNLTEILIDKISNEKIGDTRDLHAKDLGLKYLSSVKEYSGQIFFSDLVSGSLYKFSKVNPDFDATKPAEANFDPSAIETKIEKIFSLSEIGIEDGIIDFEFNLNKSSLYLITKKSSELLIIDYKKKSLTKQLALPKMIDGFQLISRSSQEPDKLVFFSKAKDEIFFLNTFDLRISDEIFLSKISNEYNYVPYSILVNYDRVFVGVEKTFKHDNKSSTAGLMVFDTITNAFQDFIELDSIPKEMLLSYDKKSIFVLTENKKEAKLIKLNATTYEKEASLNLDIDIAQVSSISEIIDGKLLAIPSSTSKNIILVDTEKLIALKKIELTESVNVLRVIN